MPSCGTWGVNCCSWRSRHGPWWRSPCCCRSGSDKHCRSDWWDSQRRLRREDRRQGVLQQIRRLPEWRRLPWAAERRTTMAACRRALERQEAMRSTVGAASGSSCWSAVGVGEWPSAGWATATRRSDGRASRGGPCPQVADNDGRAAVAQTTDSEAGASSGEYRAATGRSARALPRRCAGALLRPTRRTANGGAV